MKHPIVIFLIAEDSPLTKCFFSLHPLEFWCSATAKICHYDFNVDWSRSSASLLFITLDLICSLKISIGIIHLRINSDRKLILVFKKKHKPPFSTIPTVFSKNDVSLCWIYCISVPHVIIFSTIKKSVSSFFRGLKSWQTFRFRFSVEMRLFLKCQRLIFVFNFNSVRSPKSFFVQLLRFILFLQSVNQQVCLF